MSNIDAIVFFILHHQSHYRQVQLQSRYDPQHASLEAIVDIDHFYGDLIPSEHELPPMNELCPKCGAYLYAQELRTSRICCLKGKVLLPLLDDPPLQLNNLFFGNDSHSNEFLENIRAYNSMFAFTSLGAEFDSSLLNRTNGPYTFRVHGQMHHSIGPLLPPAPDVLPIYAQIFFQDSDYDQAARRHNIFDNLNIEIIRKLQRIMNEYHPYVQSLRTAREQWSRNGCVDLYLKISDDPNLDRRIYNKPEVSEVAAIIPRIEHNNLRDIILTTKQGPAKHIHELNSAYDCLAYPLFGTNLGFCLYIPYRNESISTRNKKVSVRAFYAYRLHRRDNEINLFLHGRRLFQQFLVDQYMKYEQNNMRYIRTHQRQLRAEVYQGLTDQSILDRNNEQPRNTQDIGQRIILPSSYQGSPRQKRQLFQDAMAIVAHFGKPTYLITVTANPKWIEIQDALSGTEEPYDRPDIVARVFSLKLKAIMQDLTTKGIFGTSAVAHLYVIEFQKRGLPHAHIILIMHECDQITTVEGIDNVVCAELPNPDTQPILFSKVVHFNLHGPCGLPNPYSPCMQDGKCTKYYPKDFNPETYISETSYPIYRRRNDHRTYTSNRQHHFQFDNRWVVPYNPFLTSKYNCHINVEVCAGFSSIKYLYLYLFKNSDSALVQLMNPDECEQFINARYISAAEACWKLYAFKMSDRSHSVTRLPCHLPGMQYALYQDGEPINDILEENAKTQLTEFFKLCQTNPNDTQNLRYIDIPKYYSWNKTTKEWKKRRRVSSDQISRIYTVDPSQGERYFLRTLLNIIPAPTSFQDVRTYDGRIYDTFRDAAKAQGLLQDDEEWNRCMDEAASTCPPSQLRHIFTIILVFCNPIHPTELFDKYAAKMGEDVALRLTTPDHTYSSDDDIIKLHVAKRINDNLLFHGKEWSSFNLPELDFNAITLHEQTSPIIAQETNYDRCVLETLASDVNKFNTDQRHAFESIQTSLDRNDTNNLFFLDGPGGHGKTFFLNALMAHLRLEGHIVIAVASSGIAAQLLCGGRTAYTRFNIPFHVSATSTCYIPKQSALAELIRQSHLTVWDEISMAHKYGPEALDRSYRDVTGNYDHPFGKKKMLFAGDFRQTLPIVPNGTPSDIMQASFKNSFLWKYIQHLELTENMRLHQSSQNCAQFLLDVGNGTLPIHTEHGQSFIQLPHDITNVHSLDELIYKTFGPITHHTDFSNKIILSIRNDTVKQINDAITKKYPGYTIQYQSADSIIDDEPQNTPQWPTEYLNKLHPSGFPPHILKLKKGMIIMSIRNISPSQGILNGTRLRILQLLPNLIEGTILNGPCKGKNVFLPRINLTADEEDTHYSFKLSRRQFPIQVAFAITISKSQGQSVDHVGIYLPEPVFSHGQLYVALSRCTNLHNLNVYIAHPPRRSYTANIVYKQILN